MKVAIVDDERPARSELKYLVEKLLPQVEVEEIKSGKELIKKALEIPFDCVFLDINLGDIQGVELASIIQGILPQVSIVFATAYDEFALEAFEVNAIDYIMKPFEEKRVAATIKKIIGQYAMHQSEQMEDEADQFVRNMGKLAIGIDKKLRLVDIKDIAYIEVNDRCCKIHTTRGVLQTNQSLKYFEEKLVDENFLRINKGYIINLEYVVEIEPSFNNTYIVKLKGFEKVPLDVSRNHIKKLKEAFMG